MAARVGAIERTVLGDRRPYAGGNWLKTLTGLERARVWWAGTDATEEYEDALFSAFAAADPRGRPRDAARPDGRSAVRQPPLDRRRAQGARPDRLPRAGGEGRRPAGRSRRRDAARRRRRSRRTARVAGGRRTTRRTGRPPAPRRRAERPAPAARHRTAKAANARAARAEPVFLSAEGIGRLREELAELTGTKRPEVIARIKSAKELGDLKENADYSSAREEQSFLEGRIASIEALLRDATVIEAPAAARRADRPRVEGIDRGWSVSRAT